MSRLVCKNHMRIILERTGMGTRLELALWYWAKCEPLPLAGLDARAN